MKTAPAQGYRYAVLGSGRQGAALAYDLAKHGEAGAVLLLDADVAVAQRAAERLQKLLPRAQAIFMPQALEVSDSAALRAALKGCDVALSAVPYRFNAALARAAVDSRVSFLDLGGNTAVVREELSLHERAQEAGASVVPDCGLAPGLGNHLAAHGIAALDEPRHVHVRCGGLPERPVGPLGYKLVFNFEGLVNEYSGAGEFLRGGRRVDVPALTEPETIDFGPPLGALEAAVTSGGTSTCPETWLGKLETFDYKTLRHPGHWSVIRALFDLGCFEARTLLRDGRTLEPRALTRALFEERLAFPEVRDLVVLRTTVAGRKAGRLRTLRYDVLDRFDETTGFSAMERATAFPAALVAHFQARRLVPPGARPLEVCVPPERFLAELEPRGIAVKVTTE